MASLWQTARTYLDLGANPFIGLQRMYERHGQVCRLGAGPFRFVYLLGPEANRFVFANSELFRWREAFDALVAVDGETALIVSDGDDHKRRRRLVQPAFLHRRIAAYADTFRANADAAIDGLRDGNVVDIYQLFRRVIRRSTIQLLFGERLAAEEAFFGDRLQLGLDLIDASPLQALHRLGTPAWRRAQRARAEVDQRLYAEIEHRRTHPSETGSDVLSALIATADESDGRLTDTEIRDQVISLIAAGYETTSAAMAWAVYALLSTPGEWETLRERLDEPSLDAVVSETLRLYPPAVISARWSVAPFDFDGVRVPARSFVLYSPYVTHRLPELWPEPERFVPGRWLPGEALYRKPGPHEYLPFGGGPHRCIGAGFATTELGALLDRLVRRTRLELVPQRIRPTSLAAMRPRDGLFVRVTDIRT